MKSHLSHKHYKQKFDHSVQFRFLTVTTCYELIKTESRAQIFYSHNPQSSTDEQKKSYHNLVINYPQMKNKQANKNPNKT